MRLFRSSSILFQACGIFCGVLAAAVGASGAEPVPYLVKSWTTADGLPQNTVNAIAETPDGYLWVGTRSGLARFDGVRFVSFGLSEGLKGLHIRALLEDGGGGLWIATRGGGLSHLKDGVITTRTAADGLLSNEVLCLARDGGDGLWVGTIVGLQHLGKNGFSPVGGDVLGKVPSMAMTPDDGLWVVSDKARLARIRSGPVFTAEKQPEPFGFNVSRLLVDSRGGLLASLANEKLMRRKDGQWTEVAHMEPSPHSYPYCLAEGAAGEIWAGTQSEGLHLLGPEGERAMPGVAKDIRALHVSRDGLVWVGTDADGLCRLKPSKVRSVALEHPRQLARTHSLVEEPDGTLWAASYGAGLFHGPPGQLRPFLREGQPAVGNLLRAALRMRDGTLHVAGEKFLASKAPGSDVFDQKPLPQIPLSLCEGPDGALWLGNEAGELQRLVDGRWQTVEQGVFPSGIGCLIRGAGQSMWVATRAGLFRWENGKAQSWTTAQGLPTDLLTTLYLDSEDTLWIGTAGGGLAWLEGDRIRSVDKRHGLAGDVVMQILEDDQGHLWLGSHHGVMRLKKAELRAVAAGMPQTLHPLVLNESRGLISAECTTGYSPAGLRSRSGMLHFATDRGVVSIDPKQWNQETPPPKVVIEAAWVAGRPVRMLDGALTLPPGTRDLEIEFTAFHFAEPEDIHFRHRLGEEGPWQHDLGARSIRYSHLPPGEHVFEVSASHSDMRWQPATARLRITMQPHVWETGVFRLLLVGLLVASGSQWARWRLRARRRKEIEELERLREKQRADEKFRLALESSPNAIVLAKEDGRIVLVNEQTEKWFGHTRDELAGQEIGTLIPDWPHAAPETKAMNTGRERFGRRKDGTLFPVEIRLSRFETDTGPLTLAAIEDITQRRQAEQELARLSRISILGEFAGAIAHELNQPLAAMLSNSQVGSSMMDQPQPDKVEMKAILDDITADAKRAGGIIHGMRAMFKKEGAVPDEAVDVNEAVKQLLDLLHSEIMARKVKMDLQFGGPLPCVPAGRVELQQVLMNLLLNALDALRGAEVAQPRITLRTALEGNRVLICVQDNGPGIPAQILERLFEAFTTSKPTGLGLGLAISQGIIKRFGGQITGENAAEGGAVFRITLPAVAA